MLKSEIITKFETYMDDLSELSTVESEELFDKIYNRVNVDRPWEGTKQEYTGTGAVTLPTDFLYLVQNYNYTDESYSGSNPVVFVNSEAVKVVTWSDRNRYTTGVAYVNVRNNTLDFTDSVVGKSIAFDYVSTMPTLLTTESPWFPSVYHDVIYHGMCVDAFQIMQADKAKAYTTDHAKHYKDYIDSMALWNARLTFN